jgi:hypothetical protein
VADRYHGDRFFYDGEGWGDFEWIEVVGHAFRPKTRRLPMHHDVYGVAIYPGKNSKDPPEPPEPCTCPRCWARKLTGPERLARVALYTERAARRLPLFEKPRGRLPPAPKPLKPKPGRQRVLGQTSLGWIDYIPPANGK